MHACFVWFGLWHFWRRASPPSGRRSGLAERARQGFEGEACLGNIPAEGVEILKPDMVEATRSLAEEASAQDQKRL